MKSGSENLSVSSEELQKLIRESVTLALQEQTNLFSSTVKQNSELMDLNRNLSTAVGSLEKRVKELDQQNTELHSKIKVFQNMAREHEMKLQDISKSQEDLALKHQKSAEFAGMTPEGFESNLKKIVQLRHEQAVLATQMLHDAEIEQHIEPVAKHVMDGIIESKKQLIKSALESDVVESSVMVGGNAAIVGGTYIALTAATAGAGLIIVGTAAVAAYGLAKASGDKNDAQIIGDLGKLEKLYQETQTRKLNYKQKDLEIENLKKQNKIMESVPLLSIEVAEIENSYSKTIMQAEDSLKSALEAEFSGAVDRAEKLRDHLERFNFSKGTAFSIGNTIKAPVNGMGMSDVIVMMKTHYGTDKITERHKSKINLPVGSGERKKFVEPIAQEAQGLEDAKGSKSFVSSLVNERTQISEFHRK